jgi:hypothetical protein
MSSVDLSPEERAKIVAERADVKYGPFASLHEAYGVLAEELWELARYFPCALVPNHDAFMSAAHDNDENRFVILADHAKQYMAIVLELMQYTKDNEVAYASAIAEAIDVIAVCDRIIAQWGEPS